MLRATCIAVLSWGGASAAAAHPHIFIDAGLELHFDAQGRLAELEVVWVYDEFYSMLMIDDLGLDPDYTGTISDAGRAELAGFDMNWVEGYDGDLYAHRDGAPVVLSGPRDWTADYDDGRIVTTHRRSLEVPVDPVDADIAVEVYDPTYYTEYSVKSAPRIVGRDDCAARVNAPDRAAAEAMLQDELDEMIAEGADSMELEAEFPEVGAAFAEEVRIECAGSS